MHSELLKNMRGGRNPDSSLSRGPEATGRQRSVGVCKNLLDEAVHSLGQLQKFRGCGSSDTVRRSLSGSLFEQATSRLGL